MRNTDEKLSQYCLFTRTELFSYLFFLELLGKFDELLLICLDGRAHEGHDAGLVVLTLSDTGEKIT